MDENVLEIRDFQGEGYQPLIDYETWRVAILRYLDELHPEKIASAERHMATDEVFVLLRGKGVLILGGNAMQVDEIIPQPMQPGILYNVKCGAWHTILLSPGASVLLVENRDTSRGNSEYIALSRDQRQALQAVAQQYGFG